MYIFDKRK